MRKLTDEEIETAANRLNAEAYPMQFKCPSQIGLPDFIENQNGLCYTNTPCIDCWRSALQRVAILDEGEMD